MKDYTFKIIQVIFRFIKEIGLIIYFFISNEFQTLNKFPNKRDIQEFFSFINIFISFTAYEGPLIKYESIFIVLPLVFLIITIIVFFIVNIYMWFIYMYQRIKIYERNFRDKNVKKKENFK